MAPIKLTLAPEAQQIAEELIPQYHQHLEHADLLYVFTTQKRTKNGKRVLGSASKLSAKERFLIRALLPMEDDDDNEQEAAPAFLILFDSEAWSILSAAQRVALVDHELCHCSIGVDAQGNATATIRAHDVEEFGAVIERHGLWQPDVAHFATVVQHSLFDVEAKTAWRSHLDALKLEVAA